MKKICIFNSFYPLIKGGAEYQAKIIAEQLSHSSDVFFISYGHLTEDIIYEDNIKIYCLQLKPKYDTISLYHYSAKKIQKILMKEKPDVIYQRILNSYSWHLANIAQKYKIHLFIHIADNYCLEFNRSLRGRIKYYFFKQVIKRYKEKVVSFITQTNAQNFLLESYSVKSSLQFYNLHPMPKKLVPAQTRFLSKKIIWIGSVRQVKNFELFLNLVKDLQHYEFSFLMLGRFEGNDYSLGLQQRASSLANLECLGEVDNSEVNSVLSNAFLLVNTSFSEGFSNTFVQAWLRGVPVVSYNVDPDSMIQNEGLGLYCNKEYEELKHQIVELSDNAEEYIAMSDKCLSFASKNFIIKNSIQPLLDMVLSGM